MEYSGAWEKLIHEKNLKSKFSWHCPFKINHVDVPGACPRRERQRQLLVFKNATDDILILEHRKNLFSKAHSSGIIAHTNILGIIELNVKFCLVLFRTEES